MNAVDRVFLKAAALLCRYHVSANVKSKKGKCLFTEDAKEKGKESEMYADIMAAWEN
ncbi:hypothetical protein A2U01_0113820, partial [Trifolium medium]|nr:hypothetical protein [Trifolium medium]